MNLHRPIFFLLSTLLLTLVTGCGPHRKQVTDLEQKEAALLGSEAQFAMSVKDWARAEGLLLKAVQKVPAGDYWRLLGSARVHAGNKTAAKTAYLEAVAAYELEAKADTTKPDAWMKQSHVLALLGRIEDSKAAIAKAAKRSPDDPRARALLDPKQFEKMLQDPAFKEASL